MNQHYIKIICAVCVLFSINANAQQVEFLNANNINAGIPTGGVLFFKADTPVVGTSHDSIQHMFEVPKGSDKRAVFSSSIWMGGMDASNNLHCSSQRYIANEFFNGPLDVVFNQAYRNYFNRVFKVTKTQLNAHINLQFPASAGQVNNALLMWPAKGNPHVQNAYGITIVNNLAPFVDIYPDGIYDPTMGDFPDICSEEAVFFVFNDVNGPVGPTGANLGIEVRGLAELYIDNTTTLPYDKRVLNNTVFVSYEIENKSTANYNNFYIGQTEDMDLGCFENDRIGCDTSLNLMTGYNAMLPEPGCQNQGGYENAAVAHGIKLLNHKLNAFGYYINSNDSTTSDPQTGTDFYNCLQGKWKDGTLYKFGGDGLDSASPNIVKHMFPGSPNDTTQWSEVYPQIGAPIPGGDRRSFGSTGPMNFAAGEIKIFDLAFFVSYDSTDTSPLAKYRIVDTLKRDADLLQSFYDNNILPCRAAHQPVGINEAGELAEISLFPNPSSNVVNIQSDKVISSVTLLDIQGNLLRTQTVNSTQTALDVSKLAKGIYLLQLKTGNGTATRKVAVN